MKLLDEAAILREETRAGRRVVVAENHSRNGGLGEAVASLLMRSGVHPAFDQIALPDEVLLTGGVANVAQSLCSVNQSNERRDRPTISARTVGSGHVIALIGIHIAPPDDGTD